MMCFFTENKVQANRRVSLSGKTHIHTRYVHITIPNRMGPSRSYSYYKDNLVNQVQKQYSDMCQDGDNTLCWHYHPEYIDDLDPPDAGAGNHIRFWFGFYLDGQLWDYGNVDLWYLGIFPASHQLILITNLLIKAWRHVFSQTDSLDGYFTKLGCGM